MVYRTITIVWLPHSQLEWGVFTAARLEAAEVWNWLVEEHASRRTNCLPWPSKAEWQRMAKGRFPSLHSQSVQQTIADFCEAVQSTTELRRNGQSDARYPFRKPKYRQVIFTNQAARIRDGVLILPCGQAGDLRVEIPEAVTIPGRLMEIRLNYGSVEVVCQISDEPRSQGSVIGVDLGVNTLLAATDGDKAILVSGRKLKSVVRLRNKNLGEIVRRQSSKTKGSRRWKKLQRRKKRTLAKNHRRIRDLCHKATRKVADQFPDAKAYVGEPFNDAAQKVGRVTAQQVSQACNSVLIHQLGYKLGAAIQVNEAYTSQTCPVCGVRNKCRRTYRCNCGVQAKRDVIGATNILAVGTNGMMVPGRSVPNAVYCMHPTSIPERSG